jgi:hypothetical protein
MTDNEIIKALSICYDYNSSDGCEKCPYYGKWLSCGELKAKDALDLINRQKAEIERLSDRNHKCIYLSDDETTEYCVDGPCPKFKTEAQIKAEAVKEFAERLKEVPIKCSLPLFGLQTKSEVEDYFNDIMMQVGDAIDSAAKDLISDYTDYTK